MDNSGQNRDVINFKCIYYVNCINDPTTNNVLFLSLQNKKRSRICTRLREMNYIAYDLGDLSSLLDIRSLKFRSIRVGVLHIFSIRNLMKETVLIGKENKLVIPFSYLHSYRIISPCHDSFKSTLTLCYFFMIFAQIVHFTYIFTLYTIPCLINSEIDTYYKIGRKPIWKYFSIQRSMKMFCYLSVYADSLAYTQHPWSHPSHIHPSRRCRQIHIITPPGRAGGEAASTLATIFFSSFPTELLRYSCLGDTYLLIDYIITVI